MSFAGAASAGLGQLRTTATWCFARWHKELSHILPQLGLIVFDKPDVVAALSDDGDRQVPLGKHGVATDDTPSQVQLGQQTRRRADFILLGLHSDLEQDNAFSR